MSETRLPHDAAVDVFVARVEDADIEGLERLVLFGSVARRTHGRDSDIDVLAVVADSSDVATAEERLRDIAYDVMLEHGAAFSIHGVAHSRLEERSTHPFFENVLSEGETIYG